METTQEAVQLIYTVSAIIGWAILIPDLLGIMDFLDELIDAIDVFDIIDESPGLGKIITAFLAVFGSLGLALNQISHTQLWVGLSISLISALTVSYAIYRLYRYTTANQTVPPTRQDYLGLLVKISTALEPGEIGRAMSGYDNFTVKSVDSELIHRGEQAVIIGIEKHYYLVKRKRTY